MITASLMVGGMLVAGGLRLARSSNQANRSGSGEAIISPSAILLDGQYHVLRNETYRCEGVCYDTHSHPRSGRARGGGAGAGRGVRARVGRRAESGLTGGGARVPFGP